MARIETTLANRPTFCCRINYLKIRRPWPGAHSISDHLFIAVIENLKFLNGKEGSAISGIGNRRNFSIAAKIGRPSRMNPGGKKLGYSSLGRDPVFETALPLWRWLSPPVAPKADRFAGRFFGRLRVFGVPLPALCP